MLAFLSPAKNLRPAAWDGLTPGRPQFLAEAAELAGALREQAPWQLESLLRVNPELALRAFADYHSFDPAGQGSPALLSFHGLAYQSMAPEDFTPEDFAFAEEHIRILSALYGVLRPCDGVQPYRLDFQSGVRHEGRRLYAYWGDKLCRALFAKTDTAVNLASGEYARAVLPWLRQGERVVTCEFVVNRRGKLITLPTLAKMARGRMARFLTRERLTRPEELQAFEWEGLSYVRELSGADRYVFLRQS